MTPADGASPLPQASAQPVSRASLEQLIQAAIDALDTMDGDADLEPSISIIDKWCDEDGSDRELDPSDDEPGHDEEHLLGWSEAEGASARRLGSEDDAERSLGWSEESSLRGRLDRPEEGEPSLCPAAAHASENQVGRDRGWRGLAFQDDREEEADAEHSLGWSERSFIEGEGGYWPSDELEDDGTGEPLLGAPEGAQTFTEARCGSNDEREETCEDEGAQFEGEGEDSDAEGTATWLNPLAD